MVYGTLENTPLNYPRYDCVRLLTCQATSINESLVPFRGLDVEKIEEHVKDNFLRPREHLSSHRGHRRTLVSREGIRRVLTMDLIAL